MANEATVNVSLQIKKGKLEYLSRPTSFRADVSAAKGPTPGLVTVSPDGTDIDLSLLDTPGLAWVTNLDDTNYVTWGIYDADTDQFYAVGEVLPGECYPLRLSRVLGTQYDQTGTQVTDTNNTLRFKASVAAVDIRFEAFEK